MEKVDILSPPNFEKSGVIKTREQGYNDGDWIGTFNLRILNKTSNSIIYQIRSPKSGREPGKFDVSAGGHYEAGEELKNGLREAEEELGKKYKWEDVNYIGRKLNVSYRTNGKKSNTVLDIAFIIDNEELDTFKLQEDEVYGICKCSISELIKVHTEKDYSFKAEILKNNGEKETKTVTKNSFPANRDNYHYKITLLADKYLKGEKNIIY